MVATTSNIEVKSKNLTSPTSVRTTEATDTKAKKKRAVRTNSVLSQLIIF